MIRLYGTISDLQSLVLTQDDRDDISRKLPKVLNRLQLYFIEQSLLFLGYDLKETYLRDLYRQVTRSLDGYTPPAFAVQWPPDKKLANIWKEKHFSIIEQHPPEFLAHVKSQVRPVGRTNTRKQNDEPLPPEPYKFLDFFTSEDAAIFYGRDSEIEQLKELVLVHPLSVLYGTSGVGKTSLIKAKIAPFLSKEKGYLIVDTRPLGDPRQMLEDALRDALHIGGLQTPPDPRSLRSMVERYLPPEGRLVIILDQFEELFIRKGEKVRAQFLEELVHLLTIPARHIRCLISLRSDYLHCLDELKELLKRDPLQDRMRLSNLGPTGASAAITKPAIRFKIQFEEKLVDELLNRLHEEGIEPAQLQIVCYRLWQDWKSRGKPAEGFTLERYKQLGELNILTDYLDDVIHSLEEAKTRGELRLTIDSTSAQEAAQAILKSMISANQTKVAVNGQELHRNQIVHRLHIPAEETDALLRYLQNQRIIRHLPDTDRYELAHEHLIKKIWDWISAEEKRILYLQDMIAREIKNHEVLGTFLSIDSLNLFIKNSESLSLDKTMLRLLLLSAIEHGQDTKIWIKRMELKHSIEVLSNLLATSKTLNSHIQIARALAYTSSSKAINLLQNMLEDQRHEVRRVATDALIQLNIPETAQALFRAAQLEDNLLKISSILAALQKQSTEYSRKILILLAFTHRSMHVQSMIKRDLLDLDESQKIFLIITQINEGNSYVRQAAIEFIRRDFNRRPSFYNQFLHKKDYLVCVNIIKVVERSPEAIKFLLQAMRYPSTTARDRHGIMILQPA